jgi:hypothetical protein
VTSWGPGELRAIEEAMAERLRGLLSPGERLAISGASSADEVLARFVLEGGTGGERVQLEARVDPAALRVSLERARDLVLDSLDLSLLEYLDCGRAVRFAGVWQQRELRGQSVAVRAERTFPALEAQADALLGDGR